MKKIITLLFKKTAALLLLCNILFANNTFSDHRGSIISSDGVVLAQSNSEQDRFYPQIDSVSPLIGFVRENGDGVLGIEQYTNAALLEGVNVHLTIDLSLQKEVNEVADSYKEKLDADEVLVAVMDSSTGKVLTMTTSNRYDANHLTPKDIPNLVPKFSGYPYEPGAVMMPVALAIAIDKGLVEPETVFSVYNGRMELENGRFITDSRKFNTLNTTEMMLYSSRIGISQISWLLSGYAFRNGLEMFGFTKPSGIEFYRDKQGFIRSAVKLENRMFCANTSYGYGMLATFTQLLKAYSAFNNDGIVVVPTLVDSLSDNNGTQFPIPENQESRVQAVSSKTAKQIHTVLVENVKRGTAVNAQYDGLEIGGKTGTAHIYREGKYRREYHSSFYGFANDSAGHKYTIGVMAIRAKAENAYFSSWSAVPVFREIVGLLVGNEYLLRSKESDIKLSGQDDILKYSALSKKEKI